MKERSNNRVHTARLESSKSPIRIFSEYSSIPVRIFCDYSLPLPKKTAFRTSFYQHHHEEEKDESLSPPPFFFFHRIPNGPPFGSRTHTMQSPSQPSMRPRVGPDPLALLLRSRGYQKQQEQKKKRILILLVFLLLAFGFGYGVYAYVNDKWPFKASTPGPSTRPGPSRPSDPSGPSDPTYQWNAGPWGSCSVTCGGGTQTRTVMCEDTVTGATASESECEPSEKPDTSQECNTHACQENRPCEYTEWGPWDNTECEVPTGSAWDCKTRIAYQHRERKVANPASGSGQVCDTSYCNLNQVRHCTVDADPPQCQANRNQCNMSQECNFDPYQTCPPGTCSEYTHSTEYIRRDELAQWHDEKC